MRLSNTEKRWRHRWSSTQRHTLYPRSSWKALRGWPAWSCRFKISNSALEHGLVLHFPLFRKERPRKSEEYDEANDCVENNSQWTTAYLPTLPVFLGVSKFFIKSPCLLECLLGDFRRLFLDVVFNGILTMQRFLDVSRFLYSGGWQVWQYYEINRGVAGALPSTKNHQGGISDEEDESNGKMFECPGSARCPVQTVKNYLLHLNPEADFFYQKPRAFVTEKLNPKVDPIWYCNSPVGERSLAEMMKKMTFKASISPHLTNHCIRATTMTVLGEENIEARRIRAVTTGRPPYVFVVYENLWGLWIKFWKLLI